MKRLKADDTIEPGDILYLADKKTLEIHKLANPLLIVRNRGFATELRDKYPVYVCDYLVLNINDIRVICGQFPIERYIRVNEI